MRRFLLVTTFLLMGAGTGSAQVRLLGTIGTTGPDIPSILKEAGCRPGWIDRATRETGKGKRVLLSPGPCEAPPPVEEDWRSFERRGKVQTMVQADPKTREEVEALKRENEALNKKLMASENIVLKLQSPKAETAKPQPMPSGKIETAKRFAWAEFALGLALAVVILGTAFLVRNSRFERFRREVIVSDGGKEYRFRLVGIAPVSRNFAGQYECEKCKETVSHHSLESHARKECKADRIQSNVAL